MDIQKILVIKLSALGDFIQALGAMAAIKRAHSQAGKSAHITLLTTKNFEAFGRECGYFDDVIIDERPKLLDISGWIALRKTLNAPHFDRVYDLQNNDRTHLYFKLMHPKPEWVGTAKGASHRNIEQTNKQGHAVDRHKKTLKMAGIEDVGIDRLEWMNGDIKALALKKPYVILVAGSAPQHPQKRWPHHNYAALANALVVQGYQPVLIGTKDEADITAHIASACPQALDCTGQTNLYQIAALAHDAAFAIGNDTGPMHLIAATSCPCLTLFSSHSAPERHAPRGENVQSIQVEHLSDLSAEDVMAKFKPR